jgi:hypothetical protein
VLIHSNQHHWRESLPEHHVDDDKGLDEGNNDPVYILPKKSWGRGDLIREYRECIITAQVRTPFESLPRAISGAGESF